MMPSRKHQPPPLPEGAGAALLARIRWRLLPFMFLLYIVSYLDRVNVGFASLQMNRDLGLSDTVYGLGAGIFFIGYFLFEVPSNLIMVRVGARPWIARIMTTWGVISAAMMFTRGPVSFYTLRFLLGLAEAGFFPGMILYLTYWFPTRERARTVALFMTANALAGVVGGPLSGVLLTLNGLGGLAGWQWLFLLEGIPAVLLGGAVLLYLPNGPEDASWLTDLERMWIRSQVSTGEGHDHGTVVQVLTSKVVWLFSMLYFALVTGLYSISFWLPQLLKRLSGASDLTVGVVSALPYIVAAIGMVIIGHHSDRHDERRWHVAGPALIAALGLVLSGFADSAALAVAAISLAALGIWGALGPFWAMPTAVLGGGSAAAGIAWINSVGNLGGFVGPYAVGYLRDATHGFGAAMGALAISLIAAAALALKAPRAPLKARSM
jgi:ACS family tartrate transporter-like MFS transporter